MKRFYIVKWLERDIATDNVVSLNSCFENKSDAMAEFERMNVTADTPKIQVWEQLCKNDGFVQAQRRIAIKTFYFGTNVALSNIIE